MIIIGTIYFVEKKETDWLQTEHSGYKIGLTLVFITIRELYNRIWENKQVAYNCEWIIVKINNSNQKTRIVIDKKKSYKER